MARVDDRRDPDDPSLAENVYEGLVSLILSNELPADARVNINAIGKRLDVSPTPIREALTRLEDAGLVRKTHLKGYRTTPVLTSRELADLYDLRLLLEPVSARRAAERATPQERDALATELHRYANAPGSAELTDYARFSEHDALLHQLIARASGNLAVAKALERTHFHLHAFRLAYDVETGEATLEEHVRIVETIISGDAAGAEAAMTEHLRAAQERLSTRTPG